MQLQQHITTHICDIGGKEGFEQWTRPTQEEDKPYQDYYRRKHHQLGVCSTCDACLHDEDEVCSDASSLPCAQLGCDEHCLLLRKHRNVPTPEVHFGLMGAGHVVIKSATHRNRIAQEENLLGFDMEAAGMWDNFPTIVAKAVCDYADSHKNKSWQNYASVVAASCMKALLQEWRPTTQRQYASSGNTEDKPAWRSYNKPGRNHIQQPWPCREPGCKFNLRRPCQLFIERESNS